MTLFGITKLILLNLHNHFKKFPDEKSCIHLLEKIIWNDSPICPYCKSDNYTRLKNGFRYHCNTCNTSFSVTVNTVFHKTKIPLQKWFYIIYLKEKGELIVSVRVLGEEIKVTKDTANRIVTKVNGFYFTNKNLFQSIYLKLTEI